MLRRLYRYTLFIWITALFMFNCAPLDPTDTTETPKSTGAIVDAALLHQGTIFVEPGAIFPGAPFIKIGGVTGQVEVTLRLDGDVRFLDGSNEASLVITHDGQVEVPAIVGGEASHNAALYFDLPGHTLQPVQIVSVVQGGVAQVKAYLSDDSGVILMGTDYAVLEEDLLHTQEQTGVQPSNGLDGKGGQESSFLGICFCPFVGNYGELTYDASCRGRLAMWVIPELAANHAFTPPTAGVNYDADGYKFGSQIYKIDGSTCNTISVSGGSYYVNSCVNNLAALLGKKPPYAVPNGTFSNEPPGGVPAQYVR